MKRKLALILMFIVLIVTLSGCKREQPLQTENEEITEGSSSDCIELGIELVKYACDLSKYPTKEACMGYGEIHEIADGKLLVAPGKDEDKIEFGEVVWLICNDAELYTIGQVVTYTFRDVKAPDIFGEPLKIIALLVYME